MSWSRLGRIARGMSEEQSQSSSSVAIPNDIQLKQDPFVQGRQTNVWFAKLKLSRHDAGRIWHAALRERVIGIFLFLETQSPSAAQYSCS